MLMFLRQNFRWIAGGFLLTYCSSFGQTFFISASIQEWQALFDLSHGEFGRLYMFATIGSACTLPFVGRLVDTIPIHRVVLICIPMLAFAALLAAYASTVLALVIAIYLLRLFGQGMMTHIALTATGRWFLGQRGRAVSMVVLGHQGGEASIPLMFSAIALGYGFQAGWLAGAVALLVIGLPIAVWAYSKAREPNAANEPTSAKHKPEREWTRPEVLRDPIFWIVLTGVLAPAFIGTTIFYHQDYLTTINEWPPQWFAFSLMLLAATTVVVALITGAVIDRFGARTLLPTFLLPLAGSCFALGINGAPIVLFGAMFLLGISYGISATLFGAFWPEIYGTTHLGAIRSVIVSMGVLATAAGPGITGTLIDLGVALPTQMNGLGVYCLLAVMAMTFASMRLRARHE